MTVVDLIIREADGWKEITDILRESPSFPWSSFWEAAGSGSGAAAVVVSDYVEDDDGEAMRPEAVRVVAVPDSFHGERVRVWARFS
jgi:hypothetical protein